MRTYETGAACPETLGEYRDLCAALCGEESQTVEWLDTKIKESPKGRDERAFSADPKITVHLFEMLGRGPHESMDTDTLARDVKRKGEQ